MSDLNAPVDTLTTEETKTTSAEAFSFGHPISVLDRRELLDYVEYVQMDRWYEPPVSFDGLGAHLSRRRASQFTDCR